MRTHQLQSWLVSLLLAVPMIALAETHSDQQVFTGEVIFDSGARVKVVSGAQMSLGSTIDGGDMASGSVSNTHLAASAVTGDKINDGTVSNADLSASCITGPKVASSAVSNSHLSASCITGDKINDGTVSNGDLAADCIVKGNLNAEDFGCFTAGSDGTTTLDDDTVTKGKLNAEDFGDFTAGSDGTCTIDTGAITVTKIGAAAVDGGRLGSGAVSNSHFSADSITGDKIVDATVSNSDLAADCIIKANLNAEDFGAFTAGSDGTCTLDDDTVTKGKLNAEDFGDFTAGSDGTCTLDAGVVTVTKLGAGAVDGGRLGAGAVSNSHFAADSITGNLLVDGTVSNGDLAADCIIKANLNAEDFGCFTAGSDGTTTLDDDTVTKGKLNAEDFGDFTAGSDGTCTIDNGAITAAKIGASAVDGVGLAAGAVSNSHFAAENDGSIEAGHGTVAQSGVKWEKAVITFNLTDANGIDVPDGDHGASQKGFTFKEGLIYIAGAVLNATVTNSPTFNADANDTFSFAIGSAAAADDNDLTSTEADIIAKQTIQTDTGGGANTICTRTVTAVSTAAVVLDGTSSAATINVNAAIAAANNADASHIAVTSGTLTIFYAWIGDK